MLKPREIAAVGLMMLIVMAGCRPAAGQAVETSSVPSTPAVSTSTRGASATPSLAASTAVPFGSLENAAVMLRYNNAGSRATLTQLDVTNGGAIPGHAPLQFESVGTYAYSPDFKTLALVIYPGPTSSIDPELVLLDIASWEMSRVALPISGWASLIVFSSDGSRIAVATTEPGANLAVLEVETTAAMAQGGVPNFVRGLSFSQDGSGLMVYVSNEEPNTGLSAGAPQAILLDAADLSTTWQVTLEGLRDGFTPGENYQGEPHAPGAGDRYTPGVAFSPVADELYLIHGDQNRLTTVDFSGGGVTTREIQPQLSFLERLLSFGVGGVHAKAQNGTEKHAAISADGDTLYISGMTTTFVLKGNGGYDLNQTPLGLHVVDPASGEELATMDTGTDQVLALPDGTLLLRTAYSNQPRSLIIDPGALRVGHEYPGLYQNCVPLAAGGYVLGPAFFDTNPPRPAEVQVFDPHTGESFGAWKMRDNGSQWVSCTPW